MLDLHQLLVSLVQFHASHFGALDNNCKALDDNHWACATKDFADAEELLCEDTSAPECVPDGKLPHYAFCYTYDYGGQGSKALRCCMRIAEHGMIDEMFDCVEGCVADSGTCG